MRTIIAYCAGVLLLLGGGFVGAFVALAAVLNLQSSANFRVRFPMSEGEYAQRRERLPRAAGWVAWIVGTIFIWVLFWLSVTGLSSGVLVALTLMSLAIQTLWIATVWRILYRSPVPPGP